MMQRMLMVDGYPMTVSFEFDNGAIRNIWFSRSIPPLMELYIVARLSQELT